MPLTCYRRTNYCKMNWIKRVIVGEKRNRIGIGSFDCRPCAKSASSNAIHSLEAWKGMIVREWKSEIYKLVFRNINVCTERPTWIITGNEGTVYSIECFRDVPLSAARCLLNCIRSNSVSGHNPDGTPCEHPPALYTEECKNIQARFREWLTEILGHSAILRMIFQTQQECFYTTLYIRTNRRLSLSVINQHWFCDARSTGPL